MEIKLLDKEAREAKDTVLCDLLEKVKVESLKKLFPMEWKKDTDIHFSSKQSGRC